jgi:hypothetical protein
MARRIEPDGGLDRAPRPERQVAFRLGLSAETRAAALLLAKGYRIVARRWRSPVGEIDLVVRRGRLLVFVEVKARGRFDDAAEAVTERQRRRIGPLPRRGSRAAPTILPATSGSTPCWSRRGACRATSRRHSTSPDVRAPAPLVGQERRQSGGAQLLEEGVDLGADPGCHRAEPVGHALHRCCIAAGEGGRFADLRDLVGGVDGTTPASAAVTVASMPKIA